MSEYSDFKSTVPHVTPGAYVTTENGGKVYTFDENLNIEFTNVRENAINVMHSLNVLEKMYRALASKQAETALELEIVRKLNTGLANEVEEKDLIIEELKKQIELMTAVSLDSEKEPVEIVVGNQA